MDERYKKEKEKEQKKIHSNNLLEEASEVVDSCIACGLCKGVCPTFKIIKEENNSPRGLALLLKEKYVDENVFKNTLSLNQRKLCPKDIDLNEAFILARQVMILKGYKSEKNEEILNNIEKTGNIFGIEE